MEYAFIYKTRMILKQLITEGSNGELLVVEYGEKKMIITNDHWRKKHILGMLGGKSCCLKTKLPVVGSTVGTSFFQSLIKYLRWSYSYLG